MLIQIEYLSVPVERFFEFVWQLVTVSLEKKPSDGRFEFSLRINLKKKVR